LEEFYMESSFIHLFGERQMENTGVLSSKAWSQIEWPKGYNAQDIPCQQHSIIRSAVIVEQVMQELMCVCSIKMMKAHMWGQCRITNRSSLCAIICMLSTVLERCSAEREMCTAHEHQSQKQSLTQQQTPTPKSKLLGTSAVDSHQSTTSGNIREHLATSRSRELDRAQICRSVETLIMNHQQHQQQQ
jgi:hypothetical protein